MSNSQATHYDTFLLIGDVAYNVWKHRPPVGNSKHAEYEEEIVKRVKELVQYIFAHRSTGPVSVSPFISACLVEATALARGGNTRNLDLENLDPSRAFTSPTFPLIEGYESRNVHGWWSRRGPRQMDISPAATPGEQSAQAPPPPPPTPGPILRIKLPARTTAMPDTLTNQVPATDDPNQPSRPSTRGRATPLPPASVPTIGPSTTPGTSSTTVPLTKVGPPSGFKKKSKLAGPSNAVQKASGSGKKGRVSDDAETHVPEETPVKNPSGRRKKVEVIADAQGDASNEETASVPDTLNDADPERTSPWTKELMPPGWAPVDNTLPFGWVPSPVRCRKCVANDVVCCINLATSTTCAHCTKEHAKCSLAPSGDVGSSGHKLVKEQRLYLLFKWCLTANKTSVHLKEQAVPVAQLLSTRVPPWFFKAHKACLKEYQPYDKKMKQAAGTTGQGTQKCNRPLVPTLADEHGPRPVQIDSHPVNSLKRQREEQNENEDEGEEDDEDDIGDPMELDGDEEKVSPAEPRAKRQRTSATKTAPKRSGASRTKGSPAVVDDRCPRLSAKAKGKEKAKPKQVEAMLSGGEDELEVDELNTSVYDDAGTVQPSVS
ncbi:hypothetical protein LXA43DRAFT_1065841 [Ganoderma leucocontextum]|nr:hypothetical protein LXA43DRAFT_1065841 [Ganoderma leucocontextum]